MTFRFRGLGRARTVHAPIDRPPSTRRDPLPSSLQPTEISEERAAELRAWQREDERMRRREFWGTVVAMLVSGVIGCVVMAQAFRTNDAELGAILLTAGALTGNVLILGVLVRAWLRKQNE